MRARVCFMFPLVYPFRVFAFIYEGFEIYSRLEARVTDESLFDFIFLSVQLLLQ